MSDTPITCGARSAANPADETVCVACGALLAAYQTPEGADDADDAPPSSSPPTPEPIRTLPPAESTQEAVSEAPESPGGDGSAPAPAMLSPVVTEIDGKPVATDVESPVAESEPDLREWIDEQIETSREDQTAPQTAASPTVGAPADFSPYDNWPALRRLDRERPVTQWESSGAEQRRQSAMPPLERLGDVPPERLIVIGTALLIGACALVSVTRTTAGAGCFVGLGVLAGIIGLALLGTGINVISKGGSS